MLPPGGRGPHGASRSGFDTLLESPPSRPLNPLSDGLSEAFNKNKKIALLALPGGGKTLLLKRLAVAYAQPIRRELSSDNLPAVELLPIMIRCREWKDHIRQPIISLLSNISAITGDPSLDDFVDAVEPYLKSGDALILVDGLDEIHDDGERSIFVENLEKFFNSYPKVRLLVTSREAGFELVAPYLARFCTKFRIAPLTSNAIAALCEHWHRLIGGGTPSALSEGQTVARALLESPSLRRLAENPLLCTMLLVVKHGEGRLPPDLVRLYERAADVLLDTWNIKGHEALNVKEAVPQLACLAFQLLQDGKQTATEREILKILETARAKHPMIGRYAKDTPLEFLKRVELRSSLVVEGGHTSEEGRTVPFYQFRHLTFQEYLAAVAAVEGYTLSETPNASLMTVLADHLISEEWKEVIPMAAVLARNRSSELIDALITIGEGERLRFEASAPEPVPFGDGIALPPATGRLARAMAEEAIFPPQALISAVRLVALFAKGCQGSENWLALSRGPYGPELRGAAADLYLMEPWSRRTYARNSVAILEAMSEPTEFWKNDNCVEEILKRLNVNETEKLSRTLLSVCGSFWIRARSDFTIFEPIVAISEKLALDARAPVAIAAAWVWMFWRYVRYHDNIPSPTLDFAKSVVSLYFSTEKRDQEVAELTAQGLVGIQRNSINLNITKEQKKSFYEILNHNGNKSRNRDTENFKSTLRIAFVTNDLCTDDQIKNYVSDKSYLINDRYMKDMYDYLGFGDNPSPKRPRQKKVSKST